MLLAATAVLVPLSLRAQLEPLPQDEGASGLALALRKLPVTGRLLYVTAHPDDENNAVLVTLNRGRGLDTALLTLTRGDGGQNAIGPEQYEALGVLRTEELARVHRFDHAQQYFGRAVDFGYSFSVEETLEKWGREEILADVVRVIRLYRPDVILTLPLERESGSHHHQTAAILARDAFRAAADPKRFSDQIREGLRPWQAARIYQGGVGGGNIDAPTAPAAKVPTGIYDPLLGTTWYRYGGLARTSHRCQGFDRVVPLGVEKPPARIPPREARYLLVDAQPEVQEPGADLFAGIDTTWVGLRRFATGEAGEAVLAPGLRAIDEAARRATASFNPHQPGASVPPVAAGLRAIRDLRAKVMASGLDADAKAEFGGRLEWKEQEFLDALALGQSLHVEAVADDGDVVRGQRFRVTARVWNRGVEPVALTRVLVAVPDGWIAHTEDTAPPTLAAGAAAELRFDVTVSPTARYSQPYWKKNPTADRVDIEVRKDFPRPWSPPDVRVSVSYEVAGTPAIVDEPALVRYTGRWVGGEKQKVVNVVPALSTSVTPERAVIPLAAADDGREFRVNVQNNTKGALTASVRLDAPAGFRVEPPSVPLPLGFEGEEATARFVVKPPRERKTGLFELKAVVTAGGNDHTEGHQVVAYDHIQERHLVRPAIAAVQQLDVAIDPQARIGYVGVERDDVPSALEQTGFAVTRLTGDDLLYGDLSAYSTVVTGVRVYKARSDLRATNQRLLDFARQGGHVVVQSNGLEFNRSGDPLSRGAAAGLTAKDVVSPFAPYPGAVTTERVSVEDAPLTVLEPTDEVFTTPNRIDERDFSDWIQERGLNFFDAKDPRYKELLTAKDPWPANPGDKKGILTEAEVGKGTWTYVGLGLARQIAAGTPGAYRLIANLLSRPRGR